MNNIGKVKNQYMNDVVFAKDTIKTLEDTIYLYCPKDYFEVLPLLHKAYDSLALALYRLGKEN